MTRKLLIAGCAGALLVVAQTAVSATLNPVTLNPADAPAKSDEVTPIRTPAAPVSLIQDRTGQQQPPRERTAEERQAAPSRVEGNLTAEQSQAASAQGMQYEQHIQSATTKMEENCGMSSCYWEEVVTIPEMVVWFLVPVVAIVGMVATDDDSESA